MAATRPPCPQKFREQVVQLVRNGRTPSDLAKEFEPTEADRDESDVQSSSCNLQKKIGNRLFQAFVLLLKVRSPLELIAIHRTGLAFLPAVGVLIDADIENRVHDGALIERRGSYFMKLRNNLLGSVTSLLHCRIKLIGQLTVGQVLDSTSEERTPFVCP